MPFSCPCSNSLSSTGNTTAESFILHQGGHEVPCWGDEKRSEPDSPVTQGPPPHPLSPTRIYPRSGVASDLSAMLPPSSRPSQRPTLTPSWPLDQQRPTLTPLDPSHRRHPAPTPLDLSPSRHIEPSAISWISPPPRNQQRSPSVHKRSNHRPGQTYSRRAPDQYQAHPSSQESPVPPSPRQHDTRMSRPTPSIPPAPGRSLGEGGLDQRLAAITPADSKLTRNGAFRLLKTPSHLTQCFVCRIPLRGLQDQTRQMVPRGASVCPACTPADPGTGVGYRTRTCNDQVKDLVCYFPGDTHWDISQLVCVMATRNPILLTSPQETGPFLYEWP